MPAHDLTVPAPSGAITPSSSTVAYALAEKSEATRKAYRSDIRHFQDWCTDHALQALPASPEAVADYLAHLADKGLKASTIGRRLAAVRYAHKLAGLATPTDSEHVKATLRGIRRVIGTAPDQKAPATAQVVLQMVQGCRPDTLKGLRDRALLLLGFSLASRRSELVALDVADLEFAERGLKVTIRKSKTDQEGQGRTIAVPYGSKACPVAAVRDWLEASGIQEGPVFRPVLKGGRMGAQRLSDRAVALVVKSHAEHAGLDPRAFSGHSLRAGMVTSAAEAGASIWKIMETSGHRTMDTVRQYVRNAELFQDHALAGLL